ncbi:MAG: hypothetical protein RLZZ557_633 [Bacteroidota bacterium]
MPRSPRFYSRLQYTIDASTLVLSFITATFWAKGRFSFPASVSDFFFIILLLSLWFLSAQISKLYRNRRSKKFTEEIVVNMYNNIIFTVLLSSFLFFMQPGYQVVFTFSVFIGMHFSLSVALKYFVRKKQHAAFHQGIIYENIVIVGANPSSIDFYNTLSEHFYYGYKCLGFIDNQPVAVNGSRYLGRPDQLEQILSREPIDEVIISLPHTEQGAIRDCIEICDQKKVKARIMPELYHLTSNSAEIDNIGLVSVINLNALPLDRQENMLIKNIFDKIFALCFFLLIGWWLFPIIMLIIKLDSRGPAIYHQERWGFNNKPITCFKFRTMIMPLVTDPFEQTARNDPRVTRIGRLLRRTSLDELPQFWNVLVGDMSIVGPRPHPTPMNLESMHSVENYLKRHLVKPGITGWAQINGCRGEVRTHKEMVQRVNLDLYYIHRWSLTLDFQIILQTVIKLIRGDQDAY